MKRFLRVAGLLAAGVLLAAAIAGWLFRQEIVAYLNYLEAPADVRAQAQESRLTRTGETYFYGADPQVVDKPAIQRECAKVASEGLLGCYTGRIYLLDIAEPEFRPEMTVTAAHEVLHAAYDDQDAEDRVRLEGLLEEALAARPDPKVNERIASYDDRASQLDEAFAILGTEKPDAELPGELVAEYARYFEDRAAVVSRHVEFQGAFDRLEVQINQLAAQLADQKRQLDRLLAVGAVDAYNARVGEYNALVDRHNTLVRQFNDLGERFKRAIGS